MIFMDNMTEQLMKDGDKFFEFITHVQENYSMKT